MDVAAGSMGSVVGVDMDVPGAGAGTEESRVGREVRVDVDGPARPARAIDKAGSTGSGGTADAAFFLLLDTGGGNGGRTTVVY